MSRRGGVLAYLGAAALLVAAARPVEAYLVRLRAQKDENGYSLAAFAPAGGRPAVEAVSTACLGGARGIIADLLWMRAIRMEEAGRSYEIVALLDGILQMQPHFTSVWAYQAHVLVFDFGSALENPDPAEGYRWIRRGIGVLEEGARRNPTSSRLEFELAGVYQRKLSPFSVDKKTWPLHLRSLHEDLQRDADRRAPLLVAKLGIGEFRSRDSAEKALRSMGVFAIPAIETGARSDNAAMSRRCREILADFARKGVSREKWFDPYLGLKMSRRHYLRAAKKPDATRGRRLLSRRMAIRCLERMGHWPQAEKDWERLLDHLVEEEKLEPDSPVYRQHRRFFRGFMRQWTALLLERGDGTRSRAVHGRMKRHFGAGPAYREVLAEEVRSRFLVRDQRGSRALHRLMREKLGERRSYEEMIGANR